ncbi:MAG: hypothetical protein R3F20_02115 [Planctomycetota bacterium]
MTSDEPRRPTYEEWRADYLGLPGAEEFESWQCNRLVPFAARFFGESGALLEAHGEAAIERALATLCRDVQIQFDLWDDGTTIEERHACIRAMGDLFEQVFAVVDLPERCFMWWHLMITYAAEGHPESCRCVEEVLERILFAGPMNCSLSALHGFGHLPNCRREEIIDRWLSAQEGLDPETRKYAEAAREGNVL